MNIIERGVFMKKTRIIALVLVAAVMLMGAGYAYWTQNLTITSTVDTGEMNVEFTCSEAFDYNDQFPFFFDNYITVEEGIVDENHKIEYSISDIYPGAGGVLGFKIENTGTVPAKLTGITDTVILDNGNLKDEFDYVVSSLILYKPVKKTVPFIGYDYVQEKIIDITNPLFASTYSDFVNKLETTLGRYVLEPGAYFEINNRQVLIDGMSELTGYGIDLPSEITNQDLEGKTFKFNFVLNFEQAH